MNKKAVIDEIIDIVRIGVLIVIAFSLVFVTKKFVVQHVDVFDVQSKVISYNVAFSDETTFVDDVIGRTYHGIVDLQKFTSEDFKKRIMESIYYGNPNSEASAKIILKDLETGKEYESYYNKELYDEKKILVEAKLIGAGSARSHISKFYVLIKENDKLKKGVLEIDVILPNR